MTVACPASPTSTTYPHQSPPPYSSPSSPPTSSPPRASLGTRPIWAVWVTPTVSEQQHPGPGRQPLFGCGHWEPVVLVAGVEPALVPGIAATCRPSATGVASCTWSGAPTRRPHSTGSDAAESPGDQGRMPAAARRWPHDRPTGTRRVKTHLPRGWQERDLDVARST